MRILSRIRTARGGNEVTSRPRKDPRNQTIGASLLTRDKMEISHERDLVRFTFKGAQFAMPYDVAFQLSGLLRMHAKQAKKFNGDGSKHYSSFSAMTNAEENYKRGF